jgi:predicted  nucleic acid-binding Zn-ribbon protein
MDAVLRSAELSREIKSVERDLSNLRTRVEEDSSVFAALEQQIAELRENLAQTRSSVSEYEMRLAEKQAELAEAKRLEALANYSEDLDSQREATAQIARAATDLLAVLEMYDEDTLRLRKRLDDMREAFGDDERVAEVEAALAEEPAEVQGACEAVLGAIGWRVRSAANGDPLDREPEVLPNEPQKSATQERRRALIKEYFGKR